MQDSPTLTPAPAGDNSPDKAPSNATAGLQVASGANVPTGTGPRAGGHAGGGRRGTGQGKPKPVVGSFSGPRWQAERRFAPHRAAYYESWTAYREAVELLRLYPTGRLPGGEGIEDYKAYLPSPDEIERRKVQLRYLQRLGFTDRFIASVMQKECPPFAMVLKARRRGLTAAQIAAKYEAFLEPTEYDWQCLLMERQTG